MKIRSILFTLGFLLVTFTQDSQAQSGQTNPEPEFIDHLVSIVPTKTADKPIEVKQLHIKTQIYGNLAQTSMDFTFYNPNNRDIAADFMLPVPNQGMISRYALDVNGVMVDGVAVEKQKARVTFEKIVRQGIDPGLVEKVAGNVFKTRIFPLPSKQSRRIQISYVAILQKSKSGYHFTVPLMAKQKVADFALNIQVMNSAEKPIITRSSFDDLNFKTWQNAYVTTLNKDDMMVDKAIHIVIPKLKDDLVLIGRNAADQYHFSINPSLEVDTTVPEQVSFDRIQLVWDASHSRLNSRHDLSFKLLDAFFQQHQNVVVELSWLRNELTHSGKFKVTKGEWKELKQQLNQVVYDGGTNLSALNKLASNKKKSAVLLFTDGLHTFDSKETINTEHALYIFSSDLTNNHNYNQMLSRQNAGKAFVLNAESDWSELISNLSVSTPQLSRIEILSGQVINLPFLPQEYEPNQPAPISGQLLSQQAELKLVFNHNGKQLNTNVLLNQAEAFQSQLPELIAAYQKIMHWQQDSDSNKQSIIDLSQQYGLVSDHTSLLVLESLEQYVEHKIEPPKSLPEMRQQYLAQLKSSKSNEDKQLNDKIIAVIEMWETRKSWWQREFPKKVKTVNTDSDEDGPDEVSFSEIAPVESAPISDDNLVEEQGRVVVTGSRIRNESDDFYSREEAKKETDSDINSTTVQITSWDPETPYLKELKSAESSDRIGLYYQLKPAYLNSPAFYFDCANFFFKEQQTAFGLQVLSNIAELKIQDSRLLRTMAMKLKQHQFYDLSIVAYRQVLADRSEEPQSHRDLGLALMLRGDSLKGQDASDDYQQALSHLYHVVTGHWDRFHGIEVTTLMEINRLLPKLKSLSIDTSYIDPRLIELLAVDIRITLSWDSDMTDIDLWVIEPHGEKVSYDNKLSRTGGMFHQDFTGGYGPEEYLIKNAAKGKYTVKVDFFGNDSPELTGATTLYVDVFTDYGRASEKKQTLSLRLENVEDEYMVGSIAF